MVAAAVLYVKDLPRLRSFYETCFSLLVTPPAGATALSTVSTRKATSCNDANS
jgi:catechol-2,3-dioxygenase